MKRNLFNVFDTIKFLFNGEFETSRRFWNFAKKNKVLSKNKKILPVDICVFGVLVYQKRVLPEALEFIVEADK